MNNDVETKVGSDFKDRTTGLIIFGIFEILIGAFFALETLMIFSMGMFGSTFLLPIYLQNTLGYTAVQAGSVFLPVGIIQAIMSPISGMGLFLTADLGPTSQSVTA